MRSRLSNMLRFGKPGASLRTRLIYPFVVLIVVAVTSTGFLSLYYSGKATENMAWQLMDEIAARIEDRVLMFLDKAHLVNEINARAIESQEINLKNIKEQKLHFWQQVKTFEYVSYSYFGHADGGFFGARRLANGKLQTISTKTLTGGEIEYFNTDTQGHPTTISSSLPYYDHKTRPWYKASIEAGKPTWSPVFIDAGGEGLTITAATPLYDRSKKIIGVLGSSFIFSHINQFLHGLKFGESGQTFIMERSGMLVATSTLDATYTTDKKRIASWESENSKIKQTGKLISDQFGDLDNIYKKQQLIIDVQGEKNFIQVSPVADRRGIDWLIVMIIPEKNFMSYIKAVNYKAFMLTLLAIGLTFAVGLTITRSITGPILELNTAAKSLAEGDWSKEVKVNRLDEVGDLERSFNLMVKNLQATTVSRDLLAVEVEERKRAEEALRRSEAKYRQLFDYSPIGIFLTTAEGKVLTANRAILKLLKFDTLEAINIMGLPNLYVDLKDRVAIWEKLKSGLVSGYETVFRRADGELISVSIGGHIVYDEEGNASLMEGTIEDITERKLMEAELRDSENKYRFLIENSIDIVWTLDLKTMAFSFVSNSVEPILGYSRKESVGASIDILFSPETIKSLSTAFGKIIGGDAANDRVFFEAEHIAKDGRKVWMEINAVVQKDKTGKPAFLNGISRDISKRKRTEAEREEAVEALRRSEEQYRQIVENASDCISRVNSMGIFTFVNPAMEKLLGYSIGDIQGHGFWEFVPDGYKKEAIDFFQDMALRQIKETYFEFPGITKSGETLWIGQISRRQELAGGEIDYLCISRDITERKRAEDALRLSEEKYRLLAENSNDAIFTTDTELRFTYISPAVRKLRGFDPEEAMLQRIDEIMTPASLNAVINEYNRFLPEIEQGKNPTVRIDIEQCHKDGSTVWVEISITTMRDDDGYLTGFVGTSRDITERKRTEAALQASEDKFRQIVSSIPNIVSILDMNLRFTYVSDSVQRILGYTPEEAMTVTLDQLLTPESLAIAFKSFQERLEANAKVPDPNYVLILELEQYHKNGSTVILENTMAFLRDANGAPLSILCVAADITERKRSEQAIRESERRLADVIDFLPLATMVIDREGRVSAWNRAMEVITGVNRADILGKGDYEYSIPFYGERRPILIDLVFASEEDLATKYSHVRRERGILTAEAFTELGIILIGYASGLHDSEGNVVGAIESVHNITDIRRVEAELKEAKKAADAANRSKSAFLANMSHEIRTPMNAILGFAQLMERDQLLSAESRDHLEIINRSGEHLLELINEILEMSKIEAGRAPFVSNTFDLHAMLHDIERMFRIRTEARGFRFLVEKVGHVPRWVVTDEGKLRQVLINLLGNAVKFTEEGGIALRLRAKDGMADTIDLQFEVEDTGPGMSEEEIGRLFQAFEQTSAGIRSGGTGLGLALSRGFVQIMGGSISVASTIGKGTAFRFEIPVKEGKGEETPLKESKKRVLRLSPGQREIRILIADDRETNRQLLSRLLAAAGFPTREVINGEEAVHLAQEWKPQVVLMDMIMPVMDGYEATRRIKASPDIMNTAIIAVTASAFEEDRQRILAAGADGFLAKPFKDTELFENIARLTGIEYLYQEDGVTEKPSRAADDAAAMRRIAAALPSDLVGQLLAAVERADLDRLNDLVGQLTTDYPTFAQQIHEIAARYEYEKLIDLFSQGA